MRKVSTSFQAIGTTWSISYEGSSLDPAINRLITVIDKRWSRFRSDTMVNMMSQRPGTYPITPTEHALLQWYKTLHDATDGMVTPLVGNTLADAGYDAHYSLKPKSTIRPTPRWDDTIILSQESLTVLNPATIDIGAAGKGWIIDQIAELFKTHGVEHFLIDGSGDIRVGGRYAETIGLEDPRDESRIIGTFTAHNTSICGSAINRRAWGKWHHIINPQDSKPARRTTGTWAIANSAMIADGLATALFFKSPQHLKNRIASPFRYVIVHDDGVVGYSIHKDIEIFS